MFKNVKIIDWDAIFYSVIFFWPTVMFSLPIAFLIGYTAKAYLEGEDIFKGLHLYDVLTIIVTGLIFLSFLACMRWAWNKTAFLIIESDGEWIGRNTFYITLWRIPPTHLRRVEGVFSRSNDENGNGFSYSGHFLILRDTATHISMVHTSQPLENGTLGFFQGLGFPGEIVLLPGPNGGKITPCHAWNKSGPVFPHGERL